jgi:hypothetical protein
MTSNTAIFPIRKPEAAVPRVGRALVDRGISFALVPQESTGRQELESSITHKFERAYGAHLTHFLPSLLRLGVSGEIGAVVGIRSARDGQLFLEQYLDLPVEQAIARAFQTPIDRDQVIEIGNLAANVPGFACTLFAVLATVLNKAGFRWVACTATPQVAAMLGRMGFSTKTVCSADPERLDDDSADWGDYYASRPRVIVGDVREAAARVAGDHELSALVSKFRQPIVQMAASIKEVR